MMKAITFSKYGSPEELSLREVPKPVLKENHVLIKVAASSVNTADTYIVQGKPFFLRFMTGLFRPKKNIPGADVSGTIVEVGTAVKQFTLHDEVYGEIATSGWGAYAQYVSVPEKVISQKPKLITFEEAAVVPLAGITALQSIKKSGIKAGDHVLITGASGGVGMFAVQIARALGAYVTAMASSKKMKYVQSLGADEVLDYTKVNFTENLEQYDTIIDIAATYHVKDCLKAVKAGGSYTLVGGKISRILKGLLFGKIYALKAKKNFYSVTASFNQKDLDYMTELIDAGKIKIHISKIFPLAQAKEAFDFFQSKDSTGKVVIKVD